jgi:hypothetical protein
MPAKHDKANALLYNQPGDVQVHIGERHPRHPAWVYSKCSTDENMPADT